MTAPVLRDYQVAAIEAARQAFRTGAKRVLLVSPTGSGKTVTAADIIRSAAARDSRVLFVAHRRELLQQTSDKLRSFEVSHGVLQAGLTPRLGERVQVASVQTLVNRLQAVREAELLIIDEAHHASAGSYQTLLRYYANARVIGLTATPWRLDGKGLSDIFDASVNVTTPAALHAQGYLAPARCFTFQPIDTSKVKVTAGDYNIGQLAEAASEKAIVGDVVGSYLAEAAGKRAVLFAVNVKHSLAMVEAFRSAGVAAEHVDGTMEPGVRAAVLARLRAGQTHVLCNVNIATEGWDCPELELCILARPTLSEALYLQMVGRVLRPFPGKAEARVHDHARLLPAFGHPYDERDFAPTRTAARPRSDVEARRVVAGAEVKPRTLLQLTAAKAIEVRAGAAKAKPEKGSPMERRETFQRRFPTELARRATFLRMALKHGLVKGGEVYTWMSGGLEFPRPSWVTTAREQAERQREAALALGTT